ncbi:hypothetical protein CLAFUW4_13509 [Fulvia fulva]|uniref:Uncharacterized protein n=1 Tax=Passalora fulva TaxID=5499 RepID=A0A9Q8PJ97_PASFU|nr:uncharacterized protein CLAFUR5_13361 [Fulvia fulva]KAK4611504.1 hypothetical protein CLAFUR4_13511 [Fulvia fulva]KAK4613143.1 hypothetical protein CLAFUR0_13520 [Fulvia fulva]UJO23488.1 hypothetical protein CLAFUR5_13361 [Fulvia fulva]WPV21454.1 hypothetical protein CLAFUW4_13509 [Fulvia fulva]WPV36482.1 hypothetical protein CLAFUW7_13516 [Fulvia fulva]
MRAAASHATAGHIARQEALAMNYTSNMIAMATMVLSADEPASCVTMLRTLGQLCSGSGVFEGLHEPEDGELAGPSSDDVSDRMMDNDLMETLQQLRVLAEAKQEYAATRADYIKGLEDCLVLSAKGWVLAGLSGWLVLGQYQEVTQDDMTDPYSYGVTLVHCIMIHGLRGRWWASDFGRRGVAELSVMDDALQTDEHRYFLSWARARVEGE